MVWKKRISLILIASYKWIINIMEKRSNNKLKQQIQMEYNIESRLLIILYLSNTILDPS